VTIKDNGYAMPLYAFVLDKLLDQLASCTFQIFVINSNKVVAINDDMRNLKPPKSCRSWNGFKN